MSYKLNPKQLWRPIPLLLITVILLGILFRFVNIGQKFYWGDEVRTSLRTAGYTESVVVQEVYKGSVIDVQDLHNYQFPNPEKDLTDTIQALIHHPEHPPLYFLMARLWMQGFGDSVAMMRSLPALISLMAFPGIYWLCLELFKSPLVGWIAVSIIAVSPLHILYAQEARQYSLWTVAILLSSAALLRAIRLKTKTSWGIYAVALTIGLYSHLLFVLVAIGQGLYVLTLDGWRFSKRVVDYLSASSIGILLFAPWIWVIITNAARTSSAIAEGQKEVSLSYLIDRWFRNINRVFFNADLGSVNAILIILAIYSIYFICRHTPPSVWLFVVNLIGITGLALVLPDLFLGSRRSLAIRYVIPCYLGIQLTFAYLFTTQITSFRTWTRRFWRIGLSTIISAGIIAGVIQTQQQVVWSKNDDKARFYIPAGQVIDQASHPLVISDASPIDVLLLSHRLDPKVKLQLVTEPQLLDSYEQFSHVFLLNPSKTLQETLKTQINSPLVLIRQRGEDRENNPQLQLWELINPG